MGHNSDRMVKKRFLIYLTSLLSLLILLTLFVSVLPFHTTSTVENQAKQENVAVKLYSPMLSYEGKIYTLTADNVHKCYSCKEIGSIRKNLGSLTKEVSKEDPSLTSNLFPEGLPVYQASDTTLAVPYENGFHHFTPSEGYGYRPMISYDGKVYVLDNLVYYPSSSSNYIGMISKNLGSLEKAVSKEDPSLSSNIYPEGLKVYQEKDGSLLLDLGIGFESDPLLHFHALP